MFSSLGFADVVKLLGVSFVVGFAARLGSELAERVARLAFAAVDPHVQTLAEKMGEKAPTSLQVVIADPVVTRQELNVDVAAVQAFMASLNAATAAPAPAPVAAPVQTAQVIAPAPATAPVQTAQVIAPAPVAAPAQAAK